jgi:hypothetical protein
VIDCQRVYRNRFTGECFAGAAFVRRGASFKGRLAGLKRRAGSEGLQVYFLTLTLSESNKGVDSSRLHRFLMWLQGRFRAHGQRMYYAWVLEYQMKRYERSGDLVRHWHIAVACPYGWLPNVEYVPNAVRHYQVRQQGLVVRAVELWRRWGFGQVLSVVARGNLQGYLMKYLSKDLESGERGARMFSSSSMGWWSLPLWAFGVVRECVESGLDILRAVVKSGVGGRELRLSVTDGADSSSLVLCSPWERVEVGL